MDATRPVQEEIVYLDLSELHAFKDHPFEVRDDAEMQALVESVKTGGVNQPALVRPREGGGYEIVAGHRRQKASELAGYHWTKAVCEVCGTINSNMGATSYACNKNVYWLYDCAADFFEELPETQTVEQVDSTYHRVITTSGEYCGFCYGTFKEENSTLERHHMENAIRPELAHDRDRKSTRLNSSHVF